MRKIMAGFVGAVALVALAPVANAATFVPGDPQFTIHGDPHNGTVSATIGDAGIVAGTFTDLFQFTLGQTGLGSGSLSTSSSKFLDPTNLDFTSISVNGMAATIIRDSQGLSEFASVEGVPITALTLNTIEVTGLSRGNGSYGGNATFIPTSAVPELATWGMMILGFGVVGAAMRRQRSSAAGYQKGSTNVSFA